MLQVGGQAGWVLNAAGARAAVLACASRHARGGTAAAAAAAERHVLPSSLAEPTASPALLLSPPRQALEFWCTVAEEEADRDGEPGSSDPDAVNHAFIKAALPHLVPLLLEQLTKQEEGQVRGRRGLLGARPSCRAAMMWQRWLARGAGLAVRAAARPDGLACGCLPACPASWRPKPGGPTLRPHPPPTARRRRTTACGT